MSNRTKPREGMVVSYYAQFNAEPLAARITKVHGDRLVDVEYYDGGKTLTAEKLELGHVLDSIPTSGAFVRFPPRSDVASERHLLNQDRSATEGEPQRGDGDDPSRLPTVEHVKEEDPVARSDMGLPPDNTESEEKKEKAAGIPKSTKKPDPSLKRK